MKPLIQDPYACPRCKVNLPEGHKLIRNSDGDPVGWECPGDNKIIWIWLKGWRFGYGTIIQPRKEKK